MAWAFDFNWRKAGQDLIFVVSLALIGWGVFLMHMPAALITVGAILMILTLFGRLLPLFMSLRGGK